MLRAAPRLVAIVAMLAVLPAHGQQPAAPAVAVADAAAPRSAEGLELSADLRGSYLAGRPIVITLRVDNRQEQALEFPKLDERPHLVSFELVADRGKKQTRYNTPPDEDEDLRWFIQPRGSRQVSLELPLSSTMKTDGYSLTISVGGEDQPIVLGPQRFLLEAPRPQAADVTSAGGSLLGWQVPWVHAGRDGLDLYLHTVSDERPDARGVAWFLATLDEPVEPLLAHARNSSGANRYVYWRSGERDLGYARLEERKLRHQPRKVSLPYPSWELLARAGGDPVEGLHVPVWIPAPSGEAGEVRVVSIDSRGQPAFRRVATLDARPEAASWVDAAGRLRLLVHHGDKLDLYTVDGQSDAQLPAEGRRLLPQTVRDGEVHLLARPAPPERSPQPGAVVSGSIAGFVDQRLAAITPPPVLGVRFGDLPERGEQAGGTAIFAWIGDPEATGMPLVGLWMSMSGRVITAVPGVLPPAGHRIIELVPRGYDPYVLITADRRGVAWASSAAWPAPLQLGDLGTHGGVRFDEDGQLWTVRLEDGRGVLIEPVELPSDDG